MNRRVVLSTSVAMLVAGCAQKREVAVVPPPVVPTIPVAQPPMPRGAFVGMKIPAVLPDGSYPTPNRALTPAATVWHLRAALNVAALACRGPQEAVIVAGYNAMLSAQKPVLAKAEATYATQWKAGGGDWQDRYDDAMTRLYNFFSQSPARDQFCATAQAILADGATVPATALEAFAAERLPQLERPFTDFYRAYDAWRGTARAVQPVPRPIAPPVVAARQYAANLVSAPITQARLQPVSQPPVPQPVRPRLELDPSVFQ